MGVVAPLYCFLHYVSGSSVTAKNRINTTPSSHLSEGPAATAILGVGYSDSYHPLAVLPAVLLGYYLPAQGMLFSPDLPERQTWLFIWQLYPVWVSLSFQVLSLALALPRRHGLGANVMTTGKTSIRRDLRVVRLVVGVASILGATRWLWTAATATTGGYVGGLAGVFVPAGIPGRMVGFDAFCREFLRWDEVFAFGAHLVWLGYYLLWDTRIKRENGWWGIDWAVNAGWWAVVVLGTAMAVLAVGPGATVGLGWLWREAVLVAGYERRLAMEERRREGLGQEEEGEGGVGLGMGEDDPGVMSVGACNGNAGAVGGRRSQEQGW